MTFQMGSTLLVARDKNTFSDIEVVFAENFILTEWIDSGKGALSLLQEKSYDLVIAEGNLPDIAGKKFIERVVMEKPIINCVVASSLSKKEFHQAYEGLGVLMQFSVMPSMKEAEKLIDHLENIMVLQATS